MSNYLLGLATLPILAVVGVALIRLWLAVMDWLLDRGISIRFRLTRDLHSINEYTLRNDIWFERKRGPIFTGHWCRERCDTDYATRWLGIGSATGRSVMFFHERVLANEATE